jgi:hypothetical protein
MAGPDGYTRALAGGPGVQNDVGSACTAGAVHLVGEVATCLTLLATGGTTKVRGDPENSNAGYVMRSQHILFKQGDREPWTHLLEHEQERGILPEADLADGTLVYR